MQSPWLFSQTWEDLLFAHWPVPAGALRRHVPRELELDEYDGRAWLGLVAFRMTATQARGKLPPGGLSPIPELNVRTYVRLGGEPGVWFVTLDASSPLAVALGRRIYGLRYHRARMLCVRDGDRVHFASSRPPCAFVAAYAPTGPPAPAALQSLRHFLVERYRLFAVRRGVLVTAEVDHAPWPLQPAAARFDVNTMAPLGIDLGASPLLHFVRGVDARISTPQILSPLGLEPASRRPGSVSVRRSRGGSAVRSVTLK